MDRKGTFFVAPIPLDPTVVQKISFSHKKIAKANKEYEAVGSSQSPQSSTIAREKSVAMRSGRIKKKKIGGSIGGMLGYDAAVHGSSGERRCLFSFSETVKAS